MLGCNTVDIMMLVAVPARAANPCEKSTEVSRLVIFFPLRLMFPDGGFSRK